MNFKDLGKNFLLTNQDIHKNGDTSEKVVFFAEDIRGVSSMPLFDEKGNYNQYTLEYIKNRIVEEGSDVLAESDLPDDLWEDFKLQISSMQGMQSEEEADEVIATSVEEAEESPLFEFDEREIADARELIFRHSGMSTDEFVLLLDENGKINPWVCGYVYMKAREKNMSFPEAAQEASISVGSENATPYVIEIYKECAFLDGLLASQNEAVFSFCDKNGNQVVSSVLEDGTFNQLAYVDVGYFLNENDMELEEAIEQGLISVAFHKKEEVSKVSKIVMYHFHQEYYDEVREVKQACVFYDDGRVKNIQVSNGNCCYEDEVLSAIEEATGEQMSIEDAIKQGIVSDLTAEEFEEQFSTFSTVKSFMSYLPQNLSRLERLKHYMILGATSVKDAIANVFRPAINWGSQKVSKLGKAIMKHPRIAAGIAALCIGGAATGYLVNDYVSTRTSKVGTLIDNENENDYNRSLKEILNNDLNEGFSNLNNNINQRVGNLDDKVFTSDYVVSAAYQVPEDIAVESVSMPMTSERYYEISEEEESIEWVDSVDDTSEEESLPEEDSRENDEKIEEENTVAQEKAEADAEEAQKQMQEEEYVEKEQLDKEVEEKGQEYQETLDQANSEASITEDGLGFGTEFTEENKDAEGNLVDSTVDLTVDGTGSSEEELPDPAVLENDYDFAEQEYNIQESEVATEAYIDNYVEEMAVASSMDAEQELTKSLTK